jgi:hypothetical protein
MAAAIQEVSGNAILAFLDKQIMELTIPLACFHYEVAFEGSKGGSYFPKRIDSRIPRRAETRASGKKGGPCVVCPKVLSPQLSGRDDTLRLRA